MPRNRSLQQEQDQAAIQKSDDSLISADVPALQKLLEELQTQLKELKDFTASICTRVQEKNLPTKSGLSLLEVRRHLLLNYCSRVLFCLLRKSEGKSINGHPVIKQMVHIRLLLEKTKPIQQKLKYQIDKLLQRQKGVMSDASREALSFKPRPNLLLPKDDRVSLTGKLPSKGAQKDGEEPVGVYRPPKINPTSVDQAEQNQMRRRETSDRVKRNAKRNSAISELRNDLLQRPEEASTGGAANLRKDEEDKELDEFEEDMFIRLQPTKESKKKINKKTNVTSYAEFDDLNDLSSQIRKQQKKTAKMAKADDNPEIASDEEEVWGENLAPRKRKAMGREEEVGEGGKADVFSSKQKKIKTFPQKSTNDQKKIFKAATEKTRRIDCGFFYFYF